MDKKLISKISRQWTLTQEERDLNAFHDDIVAMKWDGIPGLADEDYYVEYRETIGRDIIQQATNVYATQRPKWEVLPRGVGDVETAEKIERVIEWYFKKAMKYGRKPFNTEVMTHIGKYNKACSQLEWFDNYSYFCVKNYHPSTVVYEYGVKLQWVAVVNNVPATAVIEWFSDYAKPGWVEKLTKGDEIGSALKKVEALLEENEEQRVMYVDYTDEKKRYTCCWPVSKEDIDDSFGFDDQGNPVEGSIVIQDKENKNGFINWKISENEGDSLLLPLSKGGYYDNINDLETMKATNLYRRGLLPMFIQEGREDADMKTDFTGSQIVAKAPNGARITPMPTPPALDPGYDLMSAQMRQKMNASLGVQNVSQASVSNVQHSTYVEQVRMWLMQYEPNKRTAEKHFEGLAELMFLWMKKLNKPLSAYRTKTSKAGLKGAEVFLETEDINLDALEITCKILENNQSDVLQIANQITMFKQAGVRIPDSEYVERLDMGDPDILGEEFENQEIRNAALQAMLKKIISKVDIDVQKEMAVFQSQLQMQMQEAQMQAQMAQMQQQPQGELPQGVAPDQGAALPSDEAMGGQGFNAGAGGMPPQAASTITQGQR